MAQVSPSEIKVKAVTQVGIVVEDVEKVAHNYWTVFGIGPWDIITCGPPALYNRVYQGRPVYYIAKIGFAKVGSVELELLEPVEGCSIYHDFILEHGEGANHLQYLIDDVAEFDRHVEIMSEKGIPVLMGGRFGSEIHFAYLDSVAALGTIWEPVKLGKEWPVPVTKYPADESAESQAKVKVKEVYQVSLAVKDIEKTMENYWNLLGIGPWEVFTAAPPVMRDRMYYGRPANHTFKFATTMMGPVEFELIQPLSGDSLYWDFLCEHGDGISHLAFQVEDVAETSKIMEAEGFPTVQSGRYAGNAYAYYDTCGPLKIAWEAFQPPVSKPKPDFRYPE